MAKAAPIAPRSSKRFVDPDVAVPPGADEQVSIIPASKTRETSRPPKGPGSRGGQKAQTPARVGRRQIAFWVDEGVWEAVFLIAARRRSTLQRMMEEAVEALVLANRAQASRTPDTMPRPDSETDQSNG